MSATDAWVEATALVLSSPLMTSNRKDYRHLDTLPHLRRRLALPFAQFGVQCFHQRVRPRPLPRRKHYTTLSGRSSMIRNWLIN